MKLTKYESSFNHKSQNQTAETELKQYQSYEADNIEEIVPIENSKVESSKKQVEQNNQELSKIDLSLSESSNKHISLNEPNDEISNRIK